MTKFLEVKRSMQVKESMFHSFTLGTRLMSYTSMAILNKLVINLFETQAAGVSNGQFFEKCTKTHKFMTAGFIK